MSTNTGTAVGYSFTNITAAAPTTTTIRTTAGILHTITFNNPTATAVVTVYDALTATGTKIATITVPASPMPVTLTYDALFSTGLVITTATAASDITVTYI